MTFGVEPHIGNRFREALSKGRQLVGIWSMLNSATVVEGLAYSGFDWILIDGEHSPVSLQDAISHLRILDGKAPAPIIRLVWNDHVLLKQYLDAGATTIMLPYIESARDAAAAVEAMRYPPRGRRGVAALHRASRYGRVPNYLSTADRDLFLIVQVETEQSLEMVEEIAAVDGVDAVFFGPGDLAASAGLVGRVDDPRITEAISSALPRVRRIGKLAGVLAPKPEIAERHLRDGFDFVSVANDCAVLFNGADAIAARFRQVAEMGSEQRR